MQIRSGRPQATIFRSDVSRCTACLASMMQLPLLTIVKRRSGEIGFPTAHTPLMPGKAADAASQVFRPPARCRRPCSRRARFAPGSGRILTWRCRARCSRCCRSPFISLVKVSATSLAICFRPFAAQASFLCRLLEAFACFPGGIHHALAGPTSRVRRRRTGGRICEDKSASTPPRACAGWLIHAFECGHSHERHRATADWSPRFARAAPSLA